MCILGVPSIRAGAEPEGYNLSLIFNFIKKVFVSTYEKNVVVKLRPSRLVSEIISSIALL